MFFFSGAVWSHPLETIFKHLLAIFGERAFHLGEEWASPGVDPNAEFWRRLTVMSLAYRAGLVGNRSILQEHTNQDQTTRPAPVDIDIELRASMHRSRDSHCSDRWHKHWISKI